MVYEDKNPLNLSSLYMDDGYLFFQVTPVEKKIEYDSVDLEIKVYEGKQARIKKVNVTGNTKTSDHVILRDMYTHPGDLFSRDAIIRTQRQLAQNGYFDPEKLGVNPMPNPTDGTVDIEYVVEERPNDQIELSGDQLNNIHEACSESQDYLFEIKQVIKVYIRDHHMTSDGRRP